jgi:RNA polymerase sigma-70 factor (ECF subfamily)
VELTDADLVARVLADDDQHAFGELVRRHQSSVRGLLRQLTRTDIALADDLAQEAFLRAYKNTSAPQLCFAAKTVCHTMKPRVSLRFRSARSKRMFCAAAKS